MNAIFIIWPVVHGPGGRKEPSGTLVSCSSYVQLQDDHFKIFNLYELFMEHQRSLYDVLTNITLNTNTGSLAYCNCNITALT